MNHSKRLPYHRAEKRHLSGLAVHWLTVVMFFAVFFAFGSLWISHLPPDASSKVHSMSGEGYIVGGD
jgi:hypothetical protein